jgi:alkanesulfonate monooxygenase SsuD/methylene tetrahydromethanopterin reductase-like flavin-dependent oxidoreductase (luciferase family)
VGVSAPRAAGPHRPDRPLVAAEGAGGHEAPPRVAVAVGGPEAAQLAAKLGDAIFATEPEAELVEPYRKAGGDGPRYGEVPRAR